MATVMNFNSLQADVRAYLERGSVNDTTVFAQIPSLINMAERRISTELKVLGFIVAATFVMQAGVAVIPKPDRWRQTVSMNVGQAATGNSVRSQLFGRDYEYVRQYWPDDTQTLTTVYATPGPPKFYADYNYQNWLVAPTPDAAYPAEVMYYEEPALLDASNQTNWITAYVPSMLLYGTLLEASSFLKNDARIATWQSMYDRFAATFNSQDTDRIIDRNVTRMKD